MKKLLTEITFIIILVVAFVTAAPKTAEAKIHLQPLGTYSAGVFNQGASEIVAYDAPTRRLFTVNGATSRIDVLSLVNPSAPALLFSIDMTPYGRQANSVGVSNGVVAAAVEAAVRTNPGQVVFFDTDGNYLGAVTVGALPDMLTFTPNGERLLVANEGEPDNDYLNDPEGSVSIIDLRNGVAGATVKTAGLAVFNNTPLDASIRIFGPGASVAQDLEPEYIAVAHNSKTAWVTLQENNALGILDVEGGQFTRLVGLGFKDHSVAGQGLDASDRDSAINIAAWPVFGMYQPDSMAAFKHQESTFLITANEGDAREYTGALGLVEEARVASLALDPAAFPNAAILQANANLGRLNVSKSSGDFDGDGDYDALYAFGARSFSIWTAAGQMVFDSGDQLEQLTAAAYPLFFNASNTNNTKEDRSDNKGPEPEGVTVGRAYGHTLAFVGIERIGGVAVYDLANPFAPQFVQYVNNRNFSAPVNTAAAGDLGPEGLLFIPDESSPTGTPLLVVANEVSGTTTVYEVIQTQ